MRIAIATHYFHPHTGGIEVVAEQHAERLAERGHDVTVLSSDVGADRSSVTRDGYAVERYRAANPAERFGIPYPLPDPADLRRTVHDVVNGASTDVLHVHGLNYLSTALVTQFAPDDVPVVLHQHTPFVEYAFPWWLVEHANDRTLGRWNLSKADVVLAVSEQIAEYVTDIHAGTDLEVLYNGVDVERFHPRRGGDGVVSSPNSDGPTFFCLSRLLFKKGVDVVLDAWERLEDRDVDATLVLAGTGPDEATVRRRVETLSNVHLVGRVPDEALPGHYATATGFIFASKTGEAFPTLTVLEAMASGTPVVATEVDERSEGVRDGHNGLLVPPSDVAALADAIDRLATNPGLADRMGETARAVAVESFDVEEKVDRLEAIYAEVA